MIRVLFLNLALVLAQAGPGVVMTLSIPLRQLRPYPTLLIKLGVAPVPTDHTPANATDVRDAITNAVGGDTITLTAGQSYTGPFTLKSGLETTQRSRCTGMGNRRRQYLLNQPIKLYLKRTQKSG